MRANICQALASGGAVCFCANAELQMVSYFLLEIICSDIGQVDLVRQCPPCISQIQGAGFTMGPPGVERNIWCPFPEKGMFSLVGGLKAGKKRSEVTWMLRTLWPPNGQRPLLLAESPACWHEVHCFNAPHRKSRALPPITGPKSQSYFICPHSLILPLHLSPPCTFTYFCAPFLSRFIIHMLPPKQLIKVYLIQKDF